MLWSIQNAMCTSMADVMFGKKNDYQERLSSTIVLHAL